MKNLFGGFYSVDDDSAKVLWNDINAVFIFDTNALLLLYRCEKETRDAFFSQWEKIKERVWLPYHVCLEYQRNRLTAIKEHVLELENAGEHLTVKAQEALTLQSIDKKHASTIRRYESLKEKLEDLTEEFRTTVDNFVKEQIATRIGEADFLKNHDIVRDRISELSDNRIGSQPDQTVIDQLEKEGEVRYKKKIPPGFEDEKTKKDETFTFNGITYKRKFGDWFIWKEILNYVESKVTSSVIYVTNDEKPDWWYEVGGRTRGPLESLKTELAEKGSGSILFLYNSSSFLHAANRFLKGASTSKEAILEIERVSADTNKNHESLVGHSGLLYTGLDNETRRRNLNIKLVSELNKKRHGPSGWLTPDEYHDVIKRSTGYFDTNDEFQTQSMYHEKTDKELQFVHFNLIRTMSDIEVEMQRIDLTDYEKAKLVRDKNYAEMCYGELMREYNRREIDGE
ncbi:PIN-like domain-containing protein [Pantoea agglomerans]|uniref:PIN-like domain-containing protein n=1 Tax=Enterobacter agglomerans TaxID=549 RepID=UPI00057EB862|nr:PIN-like domain-containing protein [Pantoea agglomerans]KIC88488.1 hypothetical protein RN49_02870 [Pantoea agglomerans]